MDPMGDALGLAQREPSFLEALESLILERVATRPISRIVLGTYDDHGKLSIFGTEPIDLRKYVVNPVPVTGGPGGQTRVKGAQVG